MTRHLEREIERLKRALLAMSAIVEENVQKSVKAIKERDPRLAREVIESDLEIDQMEVDIEEECQKAQALHRDSLDALVNLDADLAHEVLAADDEVDDINREMYRLVQEGIRSHPEHVESLILLLSVSRQLERVADHATNIAEDVIYLVRGDIVRHRAEEFRDVAEQ